MSISYETILVERSAGHVLVVTLNRPTVANALNAQVSHDLAGVFSRIRDEPDYCRAVVLTGAGDRIFSGGGDLKERNNMTDAQWEQHHARFERLFRDIVECPVPVIAALNGAAIGGGLEIALCCDIIYAVPGAKLALTEVTLGIMPGGFGTQTLPRAVGAARAKEIIFTGASFSAEDALAWGLINKITAPGAARAEAEALALRIAANAPLSIRQAKLSIHHGAQMDFRSATFLDIEAYGRLVRSEDRLEGVRAFNEKRKPNFLGR